MTTAWSDALDTSQPLVLVRFDSGQDLSFPQFAFCSSTQNHMNLVVPPLSSFRNCLIETRFFDLFLHRQCLMHPTLLVHIASVPPSPHVFIPSQFDIQFSSYVNV
jgi:hypothetical protein